MQNKCLTNKNNKMCKIKININLIIKLVNKYN